MVGTREADRRNGYGENRCIKWNRERLMNTQKLLVQNFRRRRNKARRFLYHKNKQLQLLNPPFLYQLLHKLIVEASYFFLRYKISGFISSSY